MLLVFTLFALFASVFTVGKVSLNYAEPFFIIGSRMAVAGLIMILYQFFKDRSAFKFHPSGWLNIIAFALFGIYITNACEFWGLQFLTSSKTCFLYSASPFISAFLSFLILKESMSKRKWWGLGIGFVGLLPILISGGLTSDLKSGGFFMFSWPELALLIATAASAIGWILLRQTVTHKKISLFVANGLGMLVGGIITLGHSYFVENWNPIPVKEFWPFVETAFALLVISNLLAYNLFGYLLKRYSATFMAFAGFSTPFFAAIFGWLFLKEAVPLPLWGGLGVLFVGLVLFHQEEIKSKGFSIRVEEKKVEKPILSTKKA
jgi:drug/metabolite transporter (DMT)-like permease